MKKHLLVFILLLAVGAAFAQPGKKPAAKPIAPTQKEMEEMMKEAQKAMDEMSPEDKKMMDSMSIKMPSLKEMPKVTDKQLEEAYEDENRIVPKKDAARIASIPKAVNDSRMGAYIASIQSKAGAPLKPELKSMGDKIYSYIKSISKNSTEAGNMAAGLWIAGKPELAFYTLEKICAADAANIDNLSNYASMLSMLGAQHLAIPILNNLNAKFQKNSTLLNNLGQAWFGLGEINKAQKYLDSAIRIHAYHPQANYTKSFIEEEKGNKAEALALVKKSLQHSYAKDKEERLNKLGDKMNVGDVQLPPKTKADPLNLGAFIHPAFPKSVDECILMKPEWESYRENLEAKGAKLANMAEDALENAQNMQQQRTNRDVAMIKASIQAGSPQGMLTSVPLFIKKGSLKLKDVTDDYDRKMQEWGKKASAFYTGSGLQLRQEYDKEMEKLREEDGEQTGEGLPNKDYCPKYKEASNKFLKSFNTETESFYLERLAIVKPFLNDMTYYSMYTNWPEMFEVIKLKAKMNWLGTLHADAPGDFESITDFVCNKEEVEKKEGKLAAFDDVNCQYKSKLELKIITFENNCSRMTSTFDLMFLKYVRKDDFKRAENDTYMESTLKLSAEAGKGLEAGPLKVEAKIGGGVEFEFGRTGLEDVVLIGEAKVGIGTNVLDENEKLGTTGIGIAGKDAFPTTVEAGVEGRISIISGRGAVIGTGILEGIKITGW